MSQRIVGKVVLITGGASGIGRATAIAFAREGAGVVIGDIDGVEAESTVAAILDEGWKASCLCVDVTKSSDVQRLVKSAVDRYGGLDYAFNNAGFVGSLAGVVETSEEDWQRALATNLTSVWLCMKYEIPEMLTRQGGAIVNNGSVVGLVGAAAANDRGGEATSRGRLRRYFGPRARARCSWLRTHHIYSVQLLHPRHPQGKSCGVRRPPALARAPRGGPRIRPRPDGRVRRTARLHLPGVARPGQRDLAGQRRSRSISRRRASLIPKWWAISWWTVSMTAARRPASVRCDRTSGPRKIVILLGMAARSAP